MTYAELHSAYEKLKAQDAEARRLLVNARRTLPRWGNPLAQEIDAYLAGTPAAPPASVAKEAKCIRCHRHESECQCMNHPRPAPTPPAAAAPSPTREQWGYFLVMLSRELEDANPGCGGPRFYGNACDVLGLPRDGAGLRDGGGA